jgi:hypothetical protein
MLYFLRRRLLKGLLNYVGGYVKPARFCNYSLEIIGAFGVAAVREHLSD